MNDFTLKAPLVEKLVILKGKLFTPKTRHELNDWLFNTRRDLWKKSLIWLMQECTRREEDLKLLEI